MKKSRLILIDLYQPCLFMSSAVAAYAADTKT